MWDESERFWQEWRKHRPLPNQPWEQQVRWTKGDNARYAPLVDIQALEMQCVLNGEELPRDRRDTVRMFVLNAGDVIGAVDGNETTWVYAEWHSTGPVHGRPISEVEIQKKRQLRR